MHFLDSWHRLHTCAIRLPQASPLGWVRTRSERSAGPALGPAALAPAPPVGTPPAPSRPPAAGPSPPEEHASHQHNIQHNILHHFIMRFVSSDKHVKQIWQDGLNESAKITVWKQVALLEKQKYSDYPGTHSAVQLHISNTRLPERSQTSVQICVFAMVLISHHQTQEYRLRRAGSGFFLCYSVLEGLCIFVGQNQ